MAQNDAAEYLDSIMLTQRVNKVRTPRKRNRSEPSANDSESYNVSSVKKAKKASANSDMVSQDQGVDIRSMIENLSADLNMQFSALNERMDLLENGLEQKISSKVAQLLDRRVSTEMAKIKKDVEVKIDNVKRDIHAEVASELDNINDKLKEVSSNCVSAKSRDSDDISLNVVIRNLPESSSESTVNKVNALIKDGLRITGVLCEKAERKKNRDSAKPGVVIARLKSHDDKRKVMQQKKKLDESRQYKGVFINHDISLSERRMSDNFRTILGVLKENDLVIRGSRVCKKGDVRTDSDSSNNDRRGGYRYRNAGHSYNDRRGNNQFSDRRGGNGFDRPSDSSFQENSDWQRSGRSNNRGRNRGQGNNRSQR